MLGRTGKQFLLYYSLFFICLAVLFIPLYRINLSMVSQVYLDSAESFLEAGLSSLESDLGHIEAIAGTVRNNPRFRRLSYFPENPDISDYFYIIPLVDEFKRYFNSLGMIVDCGILYESGMILTNKRIYFPWEQFYGYYFRHEGIPLINQWIDKMPRGFIQSSYLPLGLFSTLEETYEGTTFGVNFSDSAAGKTFFFATLQKEYILSRLAADEVLTKGRILIKDPAGNLLIDSSPATVDGGQHMVTLEMTGQKRGINVTVSIPRRIFLEQVVPFQQAAFVFALTYLALGILLSLFFAGRSAKPIRKIVNDVLYYSGRRIPGGNSNDSLAETKDDFNYIRNFLSTTDQNLKSFNARLVHQEEFRRASMFEMLLYGLIYSENSWQAVRETFPNIPPVSRIAALTLPVMEDAELSVYTMRQAMIQNIIEPLLPKNSYFHFSRNLLIVFLPDNEQEILLCRLRSVAADLREKLNIECRVALSEPVRDIKNIHRAFFQIRHLLRFPLKQEGGEILKNETTSFFSSIEFLDASRLYELLYHGEEDKAVDFVNNMFYELCRQDCTREDDIQQIFYIYRRVIIQIAADFELDISKDTILPVYDSELEFSFLFANMAESMRKICALIDARHKEKDSNFERSIISFIDENITNPSLYTRMVIDPFRISENRLQTIVRKWTGKSFLEYVESKRMILSKEMLMKTSKTISQISRECGYSLENSFYKAYRRYYGQSPSETRR